MEASARIFGFYVAKKCEDCGVRLGEIQETPCGVVLKCGLCSKVYKLYKDILERC